jgi:hypothetical protein
MFKRLLPALLVLTSLPAWGTTQFYIGAAGGAEETAFNSAAGSLTTLVNFSGYAGVLPNLTLSETTTGIAFSAFTSNGVNTANLALNGTRLSQSSGYGGSNSSIVLDLPATVSIVAMHLSATIFGPYCHEAPGTTNCLGGQFTLDPTVSFFGVISDAPLADFQLRRTAGGGTNLLMISDISVSSGASAATPEPSTFALIGSGLILFPLISRRKRRSAQAPGAVR